eukprot:554402_1
MTQSNDQTNDTETMMGYTTISNPPCDDEDDSNIHGDNNTTLMGNTIETELISFAFKDDDCTKNNTNILQYAAVIGAGNLGSRIVVELALSNVNVFLYDAIESTESVSSKVATILAQTLWKCKQTLNDNQNDDEALQKQIESTFNDTMKRIHFVDDLKTAVSHPQLQIIFEAICLDNEANVVSITCGHKVMCQSCAKLLMVEMNARCPVCRELCREIVESAQVASVDDALLPMNNLAMSDSIK